MRFHLTRRCIALALTLTLAPTLTFAAPKADEIMEKVDFAARKAFSTQIATVRITTCKYTVVEGAVKCSERPRVVLAENTKKVTITDGLYNDASLSVLRDPVADRGSSLLVYEYGQRGKPNDNWLYLPALGKVNRVISSDDQGGSVFGSEFSVETTENPEARKLHEYTYEVLEETTHEGRPVWVVELTPTPEKARITPYTKVVVWVDQETYLTLKEDMYRGERVHKQRTQSELKQIDGVWVATRVIMNNLSSSRISLMAKLAMRHNVEVDDAFLTQRALTDMSFRERNLARFRAELNQAASSQ